MIDLSLTVPASVLAFVTTIHAALLALRHARGVSPHWLLPPVLAAGAALGAAPWIYSSLAGVAAGLAAHAVWFGVCERSLHRRTVAGAATPGEARVGPKPIVRPPAARPAPSTTPASSKSFTPVPILAVHDETPTIRTFRLARPDGFTFAAGQFVTVQVRADAKPHVRCYSISSAPEASGFLEITVKRQGLVSGTLHATLRPGATALVRPPAGRFVYPAADDRPLVLVGGGVGVTPLMSMLRHAVLADPTRPVTLFLSVRSAEEIPFREELAWLPRRYAHVRVSVTITGSAVASDLHRTGRIGAPLIRECVPDPAGAVFMVCGPLPMIDGVKATLASLGVPAAQVRSEVFQAATAIGAAVSQPADKPDDALDGARRRVTFARSGRTLDVPSGQTLLEAAESAGIDIPSLCRSGVCGTCRTRLVSGDVRCTSEVLDADDAVRGVVLPCVAWATGDCALDA